MSGIEAFSTVASAYEDWFASPLGAFVDQAEQTGADPGTAAG